MQTRSPWIANSCDLYWCLISLIVDANKGDMSFKQHLMLIPLIAFTEHLNLVRHGRFSDTRLFTLKTEDLTLHNLMSKGHVIEPDSDEFLPRKIQADTYVGNFIHPFQYVATEQEAVVIQVLWQHDLVMLHRHGDIRLVLPIPEVCHR